MEFSTAVGPERSLWNPGSNAGSDDGSCYVLSSVFNRSLASGLLLFRVRQDQLGVPSAYQRGPCQRRVGNSIDIRAQIFPLPTSNLYATPEQTMIVNGGTTSGRTVLAPYGGFFFPGSTFSDLHIAVSQWPNNDSYNYHVMQYRVTGLAA